MTSFIHVTPIWKPRLDAAELANVHRSLSTASRHCVQFLAPEGLNLDFYLSEFPDVSVRQIEERHLRSVSDYNALMLSSGLYDTYGKFDFLVLVQTDAVLIRDLSALNLVDKDYVGAPWIQGVKYRRIAGRLALSIPGSQENPLSPGRIVSRLAGCTAWVGNGGLSIRRVSSFSDTCRAMEHLVPRYLKSNLNEDVVFSTVGRDRGLRVASLDFAGRVFKEHITVQEAISKSLYGVHAPMSP